MYVPIKVDDSIIVLKHLVEILKSQRIDYSDFIEIDELLSMLSEVFEKIDQLDNDGDFETARKHRIQKGEMIIDLKEVLKNYIGSEEVIIRL